MASLGRLFAAAFALQFCLANQAVAHAFLVASNPREGQVLAHPPTQVQLAFSEDIARANVSVTAPDGTAVTPTRTRISADTVTASMRLPDEQGRWTIAFRVVSIDGHVDTSQVAFTTKLGAKTTPKQQGNEVSTSTGGSRAGLMRVAGVGAIAIALIVIPLLRRD